MQLKSIRLTRKMKILILIAAAAIYAVILHTAITTYGRPGGMDYRPHEAKSVNENSRVWLAAEEAVRRQLKAPSTADFGSVFGDYQDPDKQVVALDNGSYAVHGWVDAENSFGAKLRSTWVCNIRLTGDEGWSCDSIVIHTNE